MAVPPLTVGLVVAIVVLILAILGLVGVLPASGMVFFALIAALAVARCT